MRHASTGLTLVELLIVLAVIAVLLGIGHAALGPVREKTRQARCISNLRQIGQAIWMYRQDYAGGSETPGHPSQMGLPPDLLRLNQVGGPWRKGPYLTRDDSVFRCGNYPRDQRLRLQKMALRWCEYGYAVMGAVELGFVTRGETLSFADKVRRRGGALPIVIDTWHDSPPVDAPPKQRYVIVLRLDGRVTTGYVPRRAASWEW